MFVIMVLLAVAAGMYIVYVLVERDLAATRNAAMSAWAALDAPMRARQETVPALLDALDGHGDPDTVAAVRDALAATIVAADGADVAARMRAEQDLGLGLAALMARAALDPDLAPQPSFQDLRTAWSRAEDAIDGARHHYNAHQAVYAVRSLRYPARYVAATGGFPALPPFEGW